MANLLINHIENATTDEEIKAFLCKYGFPSFDSIERVQGDGSRPAVLVRFEARSAVSLRTIVPRIQGMFWNNHTITALVMREPGE
jgi:hypothetical protein